MSHNLIPTFAMHKAELVVNNITKIYTKPDELTNETHCIVVTDADNGVSLKIPLKLDRFFSYFPMRKLSEDEIESCKDIETVVLCPNDK